MSEQFPGEPKTTEDFELVRCREFDWKRLGHTMVSLYHHIPDGKMIVLVEDFASTGDVDAYTLSCGGHNPDHIYNNPLEF